jgi:hypothetical protein
MIFKYPDDSSVDWEWMCTVCGTRFPRENSNVCPTCGAFSIQALITEGKAQLSTHVRTQWEKPPSPILDECEVLSAKVRELERRVDALLRKDTPESGAEWNAQLCKRQAARIAELENVHLVEDGDLPAACHTVLMTNGNDVFKGSCFGITHRWINENGYVDNIVAWIELPDLPKLAEQKRAKRAGQVESQPKPTDSSLLEACKLALDWFTNGLHLSSSDRDKFIDVLKDAIQKNERGANG